MLRLDASLTAICHDAKDGSGDLIVQIPPEVIEAMGLQIGDTLELEFVNGVVMLSPCRNSPPDA